MLLHAKFNWTRLIIFTLIAIILYMIAAYFDLATYVSVDCLINHTAKLSLFREKHTVMIILAYIVIYSLTVICCIPGSFIMKVIAGFLFGIFGGSVLSIITYTIASFLNVTIIRWVFAPLLQRHFGETILAIKQKANFDSLLNLIALRFMVFIPFWLYNITVAISGISRKKFVVATFIGTAPISIVLAIIGNSFRNLATVDVEHINEIIYSPQFILPFIVLGILCLLPGIIDRFRKNKCNKV